MSAIFGECVPEGRSSRGEGSPPHAVCLVLGVGRGGGVSRPESVGMSVLVVCSVQCRNAHGVVTSTI